MLQRSMRVKIGPFEPGALELSVNLSAAFGAPFQAASTQRDSSMPGLLKISVTFVIIMLYESDLRSIFALSCIKANGYCAPSETRQVRDRMSRVRLHMSFE